MILLLIERAWHALVQMAQLVGRAFAGVADARRQSIADRPLELT